MIQVTGEEGVSCPIQRQKRSFDLVCELISWHYKFADKAAVRDFFTRLIGLLKNLNYAPEGSPTHAGDLQQIHALAAVLARPAAAPDPDSAEGEAAAASAPAGGTPATSTVR
jgi:hypothetical protein